jgi:hypothetical protein
MSSHDYRSKRMSKAEAWKKIRKIMSDEDPQLVFGGHALDEMRNVSLSTSDVINVLKSTSATMKDEPETKNGNVRYRVKTLNYCVVVSFFKSADGLFVVTVWKIKKEKV